MFTLTEILCFGSSLYHCVKQAEANAIIRFCLESEALVLWSKPKISWVRFLSLTSLGDFTRKWRYSWKSPDSFVFFRENYLILCVLLTFTCFREKIRKTYIFAKNFAKNIFRENLSCYKNIFTKMVPLYHMFLTSFAIFVVNLRKS